MKDLTIILLCAALLGCSASTKIVLPSRPLEEAGYNADSAVKPGIPAYEATTINYKRDGKSLLIVRLEGPAIVGVATKPEKWGFFQFPSIYRSKDNIVVAKWNMSEDAVESYGKGGHGGFAVSRDGGKSWSPSENPSIGGGLLLPGGDRIKIYTPKAIATGELKLPIPVVANKGGIGLYKLSELPEILQGVYLNRLAKGGASWVTEHNVLDDPQAVRYTISGLFPLVWWGDMHVAADGSIITGIYPGFYLNEKGGVDPSGVLFYRSTDEGHTWKLQGRIPYQPDLITDPTGDKRLSFGFTEPAFEILSDGTFLCVMRTTDNFVSNSPMYFSRSTDLGVKWTKPQTFTKAGVLPRLLQLDNGVIVLASGRPGVQLRFCTDNKGQGWTDPFEMLPFKNEKDPAVSCGYTGLLATGPNSFLLIYSDFNYRNKDNQIRKAIKVREVTVNPSKR
ncbi:MAG TPA: sialidase family protein [Chitinophagaceae bacterium]